MNTDQLTDSFIQILQCVSLEDVLISPDEPLKNVISELRIDELDFQLSVICFEATYRLSFDCDDIDEVERLSIRKLIEEHLVTEGRELLDPLFVTKRFLMFKEGIFNALRHSEGEQPE